ncbi:cysteine/serine-rich nuclear protein 1-like protein [Lates japonicus]|uniref:Cysteine/serine-rich nuclear protein 1-like protein n=1 Tax=Lates japonicus TaxID=270547 RepID=A0AAD3MJ13_LATJO|nr:cysteine/serine-rich nuclear protein 1-like protein [Lates japonicus]
MTDLSDSSGQSEDSEAGESPCEHRTPLDVVEKGLSRILSFSDTENCSRSSRDGGDENSKDTCCTDQRQEQQQPSVEAFSSFSMVDFSDENDNMDAALLDSADDHTDNRATAISELLDENANQGNALFHSSSVPHTLPNHHRLLCELQHGPEPLFRVRPGVLRRFPLLGVQLALQLPQGVRTHGQQFQVAVPSYPSFPTVSDPGTCLLESLIGLSESVPEPPATFTDNELLEIHEIVCDGVCESLTKH